MSIVPPESKAKFLEVVRKSTALLRSLPGFVEVFVYEKADGASRNNIVTAVIWKHEAAFLKAKERAAEGFKKIGFNPQEIMATLKVHVERAIYRRSLY